MSGLGRNGDSTKVSTPLHTAIKKGDAVIDDEILKDNINTKDEDGWLPIHVACAIGSSVMVKKLLNHGASIKSQTKSKFQPLHLAAEKGCDEVIELLLREGADINANDNDEALTPLHLAVKAGLLKTVKQLLSRGASVSVTDVWNNTVLHTAAQMEFVEIVEILLNHNASVHAKGRFGSTPLHVSFNAKISKMLLDKGADVNAKNDKGETSLYRGKGIEVVKILLDYGLDVNSVNIYGEMALLECTNETVARMILDKGAEINFKRGDGRSALHEAVARGRVKIVEVLLNYNADVNIGSAVTGVTPLCFSNDESISRMLISKGANVNVKSQGGYTPLHWAAESGNDENVKVLLEYGLDVNCVDNEGATPLYTAACSGSYDVAEILLDNDAAVNYKTIDGESPLHAAIMGGHTDVASVLLEFGADVDDRVVSETAELRNDVQYAPEYIPTAKQTIDVIEKHFMTLKALEPDRKILNLPWLDFNAEENRRFYDSCKNQADLMTHEKIGNTRVSFRDILTKSIDQVASYASNKSIVEAIELGEYKGKFPAYSVRIEKKFKKAQKLEFMLQASKQSLRSLFNYNLPDVVIERILSYLSYRHLPMLIQASPDITNE